MVLKMLLYSYMKLIADVGKFSIVPKHNIF